MQKNKRIELKFFIIVLIAALMITTFSGCDFFDFLNEINVQDSSLPQITVAATGSENTLTDIHATSSPTQMNTNETTDDPNISINPTTISEVTPVKTNTPVINKTATQKPATATPAPTAVSGTVTAPPVINIADNAAGSAISLENVSAAVPAAYKADYVVIKNQLLDVNDTVEITKTVSPMTNDNLTAASNRLKAIIVLIRNSCPELFYLGANTGFSAQQTGATTAKFTITFPNMYSTYGTKAAIQAMKTQVNNKLTQIVNQAKALPNSFAREVFIHDYLVKNIAYTNNGANYIRTIYGGLIMGKGVCEAYARSFQALMLRLGEETYLISGDAGEAHMWNIIELYGKYYHVDVTWDDPTPDQDFSADTSQYLISHAYLNQTDAFANKTRVYKRTQDFTPLQSFSCTSTDYNYFRIMGRVCTSLEVYKKVLLRDKNSFPSGYTKCIEVQFTSAVTAAQITTAITNNNNPRLLSGYSYSVDTAKTSQIVKVFGWQ